MHIIDSFLGGSIRATRNTHDSTYFQSTLPWEKITKGELIPSNLTLLVMVLPITFLDDEALWRRGAHTRQKMFQLPF